MNRTLPTPWKPTKAQLLAAHDKLVPDLVAKNLIVLFAGINPGLYTAAIGRHFGRPGNRFWPALHDGGFTPRLFSPFEGSLLLDLKFGITNIVQRATARADELTADELRASGQRLEAKVKRGAPRSSPSSASAPTASSPASKTPASASKRPPSAAATPGSSPTPAASTPTTCPPPSHNSSETSASGPLHSTGVDEMPVGHRRIHRARYRGSPVGLEVIVGVQS
jgi:G:T/U-mismatch repair DNA glycosylase